ncbi:MAG: hypothetical protein IKE27_02255 [Oscillospiraceae bacterium]|nr:hypothetical protein [Oscillospiraceae bacterium]
MEHILCVDMDGVLAEYKWSGTGEERKEGHFLSLRANRNLCEALQEMRKSGAEIYIVSKIMPDAPFCLPEKRQWLIREMPDLEQDRFVFVADDENKSEAVAARIGAGIGKNIYLFDDFTGNLVEWEKAGGTSVKAINEINGKGKNWKGRRVDIREDRPKEEIISSLEKLLA